MFIETTMFIVLLIFTIARSIIFKRIIPKVISGQDGRTSLKNRQKKLKPPHRFIVPFTPPPPLKNGNVPITDPGRSGLGDKSIIVLNTFV